MKILFLLPARSGSKGIPDKNIRELNHHPLMWYAIQAVKQSRAYQGSNSLCVVNTDSQKYAEIAIACGADRAMMRDPELAADNSKISETIKVVMRRFAEDLFDCLALIQITSPLITPQDIDSAVALLKNDSAVDSVVSVAESEVMPLWCNVLDRNRSMKDFINKEIRKKNRQELPVYYRVTGAIRIARWNRFLTNNFDFLEGNSKALVMEPEHSIDIDTMLDFEFAQFLMEVRNA